ncbi:unnamed protein product, partial [Polarella glacialis]
DWGSPSSASASMTSLKQALDAERLAWQFTRQETCSWQAGDQAPASPASWGGLPASTLEKCRQEVQKKEGLETLIPARQNWCWESLKLLSCPAGESTGLPWEQSKATLEDTLRTPLGNRFHPLADASLCNEPEQGSRRWTDFERQSARSWFFRNVRVYVLAIQSSVSTLAVVNTTAGLADLGIAVTRVPGFDLSRTGDLEEATREGAFKPQSSDEELVLEEGIAATSRLSRSASHFRALNLAQKTVRPLALLLEDGLQVVDDFELKVWSLVREEAPCDWDVISLSTTCPVGRCVSPHLARVGPEGNQPTSASRCSQGRNGGGVNRGLRGFLYRTSVLPTYRPRLQQVVFTSGSHACMDLDAALSATSDEIAYYGVPQVQKAGFFK